MTKQIFNEKHTTLYLLEIGFSVDLHMYKYRNDDEA
jgi:hypothetical protein